MGVVIGIVIADSSYHVISNDEAWTWWVEEMEVEGTKIDVQWFNWNTIRIKMPSTM